MPMLTGPMTARRYRVVGEIPDGWRSLFKERIGEFSFRESPVERGGEEVEGWVQIHNLLDTDFQDQNRWLYNNYAIFSLRVDKKSLPTALLKATLQKKFDAWCEAHGTERCPNAVKKQLREELEAEWYRRVLPKVKVIEACWDVVSGVLLLGTTSEAACDRFRKRFFRTFGLRIVPLSPLDWCEVQGDVEALLSSGPMSLTPREAP
jgi:DNA recombination-dependent growth factor C